MQRMILCLLYICLFSKGIQAMSRVEKISYDLLCGSMLKNGLKLQQQPMNTPRKYKLIALVALTTKIMTQSALIRKQKLVFKTQLMFVFFCFSQNNTN